MSCFIYFNVCNFAYIASPFFSPFRSSIPVRVRFAVGPPHICFFISWSIERGICRDFLFTETGASNHSDPGRLAGRQHSYSKQSARSAPPGPADDGAVQEANLPPWKEVNARRETAAATNQPFFRAFAPRLFARALVVLLLLADGAT